eukprot:Nk52_evm5s305 gene=Nk52_evmTU5s305
MSWLLALLAYGWCRINTIVGHKTAIARDPAEAGQLGMRDIREDEYDICSELLSLAEGKLEDQEQRGILMLNFSMQLVGILLATAIVFAIASICIFMYWARGLIATSITHSGVEESGNEIPRGSVVTGAVLVSRGGKKEKKESLLRAVQGDTFRGDNINEKRKTGLAGQGGDLALFLQHVFGMNHYPNYLLEWEGDHGLKELKRDFGVYVARVELAENVRTLRDHFMRKFQPKFFDSVAMKDLEWLRDPQRVVEDFVGKDIVDAVRGKKQLKLDEMVVEEDAGREDHPRFNAGNILSLPLLKDEICEMLMKVTDCQARLQDYVVQFITEANSKQEHLLAGHGSLVPWNIYWRILHECYGFESEAEWLNLFPLRPGNNGSTNSSEEWFGAIDALELMCELKRLPIQRVELHATTLGIQNISKVILEEIVRPLRQLYYPEDDVGADIDFCYSYVVGYNPPGGNLAPMQSADTPEQEKPKIRYFGANNKLVSHTDDCEVTVNVALSDRDNQDPAVGFDGGEVVFEGQRSELIAEWKHNNQMISEQTKESVKVEYAPCKGRACIHYGQEIHSVNSVKNKAESSSTGGNNSRHTSKRYAFIIWCRNIDSDTAYRRTTCPCCLIHQRDERYECICGPLWN